MRFTASKFGRVARRKKNFEKFCSDLINAKPFTSKSTEHGKHYEPIARREYEKYMNEIGHPVQVKRSGFFVSQSYMFLDVPQMEKSLTLQLRVLKISLVSLR